jgi:hypothetical protein
MKEKISDLGRNFYNEHLKQILEPQHNGEFVTIEPESGQYFLGKTDVEAMKKAREVLPNKRKFLVRIGFDAAYKIGGFNARNTR